MSDHDGHTISLADPLDAIAQRIDRKAENITDRRWLVAEVRRLRQDREALTAMVDDVRESLTTAYAAGRRGPLVDDLIACLGHPGDESGVPGGGEPQPGTDDECPRSQRVDGPWHSWQFDGDAPYIVCGYCGERRDAISGRVILPKNTTTPDPTPTELTRELRDAVGLFSGAMPITPRQAWNEAVAAVKRAVRDRDAISSIVRHHRAGHEAVDGLWIVDDGTSVTPQVVGEVTPAEANVMEEAQGA